MCVCLSGLRRDVTWRGRPSHSPSPLASPYIPSLVEGSATATLVWHYWDEHTYFTVLTFCVIMNARSRYVIFIVIVTLNLFVLMIRIMSDYAVSNSTEEQTSFSILTIFKRNTSTAVSPGAVTSVEGDKISFKVAHTRETPHTLSGFDSILNCHNQSQCIRPHLEINHEINVYFCKHTSRGESMHCYFHCLHYMTRQYFQHAST